MLSCAVLHVYVPIFPLFLYRSHYMQLLSLELSEIETVLSTHVDVRCAVVDVRSMNGIQQIVAFVKLNADINSGNFAASSASVGMPVAPALQASILDVGRQHLPKYMVPVRVFQVAHIPTLPTMKVDRAQLQMASAPRQVQETVNDFRSTLTDEMSRRVLDVWERHLACVVRPL